MTIFGLLITLIIIGLIFAVLWWAWGKISPVIPEPVRTIILVLGVLLIAIFLISLLLGFMPGASGGVLGWRLR